MNDKLPALESKLSDVSLLLGIAYSLCSKYKHLFNTDEQQSYKTLTRMIEKVYYQGNK